jgi:hypothetical protein
VGTGTVAAEKYLGVTAIAGLKAEGEVTSNAGGR